ncbi:MAG: hypothetical protein AB7E51_15125 [Pseudodesulfovibrio sp.]|uniref:hypothetical protein n=1 Tax=Pseudodesulfovibrio sp. TaxID=2035812 RepID=UPI003D10736C
MRAKCIRTCVTPVHGIVAKGEIKNFDDADVPWAKHFQFLDPKPAAKAMDIKLPDATPTGGTLPAGTTGATNPDAAGGAGDTGTTPGPDDNATGSGEAFPKHLGGGTYQLSNGEKVKGKEAAATAEAALNK